MSDTRTADGCGSVEDMFWMWRVVSAERLGTKLGVAPGELATDDVYHRLFPPERSVFWIADRF